MTNSEGRELYPLLAAQRGVWVAQMLDSGSPLYNIGEYFDIPGPINPMRFETALREAVAGADSLHLQFISTPDGPRQYFAATTAWPFPFINVSEEPDPVSAAEEWMVGDMGRCVPLSGQPLFGFALFRISDHRFFWYYRFHHLCNDGCGTWQLAARVARFYSQSLSNDSATAEKPGSFRELIDAEEEYRASNEFIQDKTYWREQMADWPAPLTFSGRPPSAPSNFLRREAWIPRAVADAARKGGAGVSAGLAQTVTAATAIYLHRLTGANDLSVGMAVTGRTGRRMRTICGMTSKVFPLRVRIRPQKRIRDVIAQVGRTMRETALHGRYSPEELRADLGIQPNEPGLYGTIANILPFNYGFEFGGRRIRAHNVANFREEDLQIIVHDRQLGSDICVQFIANAELYTEAAVQDHLDRFQELLAQVAVAGAEDRVFQPRLFRGVERQVLERFNPDSGPLPGATVPGLFEQIARDSSRNALIFGDARTTYGELNERANRIAHLLIAHGVTPETPVGVCLDRSVEMIAAVVGILKAGGYYVPIATDLPPIRRERLIRDAGVGHLLTSELHRHKFESPTGRVLALDGPDDPAASQPSGNCGVRIHPASAAYVNYTSGSTGIPKGVLVTHEAIVRLVRNSGFIELNPHTRFLHVAPLSFDGATIEIWGALLNGGTLVIAPSGAVSGEEAADVIANNNVNTALLTSGLFQQVVDHALPRLACVRQLLTGGDKLSPPHAGKMLAAHPGCKLINAYGPTENTTISTTYCLPSAAGAYEGGPIGTPIAHSRAYVLDAGLELQPIGVAGELYVAGKGLARGYLSAGATAERFVADPYGNPGDRMYRTGDRAQWRADGVLEFLGRDDGQIKLRGFRIELGEIETALRGQPGVRDALVSVREQGGQRELLGYVLITKPAGADGSSAFVSDWRDLYEHAYEEGDGSPGDFNIAGWRSSYTGDPIDAGEMRIWVEETVARIRVLNPSRVLEVGCGTGLLLTRLAPDCESYTGLDFSGEALRQLGRYVASREDLRHVDLRQGLADDLSSFADNSVDLVVLNSIVQYFPDLDYLLRVLEEAERITRPGGSIFVGDVRSKALLDVYHCSVQMSRTSQGAGNPEERVAQGRRNEKELVLDAGLFEAWALRRGKLGWAEPQLKRGKYDNELSRFRYDVTLRLAEKQAVERPARWVRWDERGAWREEVKAALAETGSGGIGVKRIRDARVAKWVKAWQLLRNEAGGRGNGEDPDDVMRFADELGVELSWQGFNAEGVYGAIFRPRRVNTDGRAEESRSFYRRYGIAPARTGGHGDLGHELREALRERLPDYMVPAAVMVLEEWPLNANGKVDRKALPVPGRADRASSSYVSPATETGRMLANLWTAVLGVEGIGEEDDFFMLGGHSLMATQVMSRVREMFAVTLGVRALFEAPQLGKLAKVVDDAVEKTARHSGKPELKKQQRPMRIPLSNAQKRLWFIDRLEGISPEYNMPEAMRLRGDLNIEALRHTVEAIVDRHESLRTHFDEIDGEPVQTIEPTVAVGLETEDLSGYTEEAKQERVKAAMRRESEEPFDLAQGPLIRVRLLRLSEREHILLRTCHHIVSDGWSVGVFNREFEVLYAAFSEGLENPLPPLPVQYADFTLWQRSWLEGEAIGKDLVYWRRQLEGIPGLLELAADRPRPVNPSYAGRLTRFTLPDTQFAGVRRLSNDQGVTPYMTLLAAFALLLERYSGQDDIVVASPIANRQEPQLEQLVGFFANTLAMRVPVKHERTFREMLSAVRDTALGAYQHQDLPFERLVEDLAPARRLDATPIVQVLFGMHNVPMGVERLKDLEVAAIFADDYHVRFDLEMHGFERDGQLEFFCFSRRELFDEWRITQMLRHYQSLIAGALASPDVPVRHLDPLSPAERDALLTGERTPAPEDVMPVLLERQARKTPEATALVCLDEKHFDARELTYAALHERANRLAHFLIARGAGPESLVGVCLFRSVEMVVALLAIIKAGAAYVPIDPDHPAARIGETLADARPICTLTTCALCDLLPAGMDSVVLDGEACLEELGRCPAHDPTDADRRAALRPLHPAYVIYTSGSTGKPKGAPNTHEGLVNRLLWMQSAYGLDATDRVLQKTPYSFDVSVWEFFWPLMTGAALVVAAPGGHRDAAYLVRTIVENDITTLHFVPSMLRAFLENPGCGTCRGLRRVICSGEALSAPLCDEFFRRLPGIGLHNLYGPTEASIDVTAWTCRPSDHGDNPPIGHPIHNTRAYVLDRHLRLAPNGVDGELYLAGTGLARGYLNRYALTAERFVADPWSVRPAERMYRTGDLARRRSNGAFDYRGRADRQVKIRGFRIEPGEIESLLRQHPIVRDAVADVAGDDDQRQLLGYVTIRDTPNGEDVARELHESLRQSLPDYMVPAAIVVLPELPLTSSGKLDRKALPVPGRDVRVGPLYAAPSTEIARVLSLIWQNLLGLDRVGEDDNFFALGGHSLLGTQVMSRIRDIFQVDLTVRTLFDWPRLRDLARAIEDARGAKSSVRPVLKAGSLPERPPLSYAQQRLWFIDQFEGRSAEYNMPEALHMRGELDCDALERTVNAIVARHRALRTHFGQADGKPYQIVETARRIEVRHEDLSSLDPATQKRMVSAAVAHEWEEPFQLATGPLIRVRLLRLGPEEHVLLRTLHHIVADGWSAGLFRREFGALYDAFLTGRENPLPPLTVQYADFAVWQREWLRGDVMDTGLAYWRRQLDGIPERLELPTDRPRPSVQTYGAELYRVSLGPEQSTALARVSRACNATPYMTLLAAFSMMLARYSGQDDIAIGSPIANRRDSQLEQLIGFFVNSLVMRVRVPGHIRFAELLAEVRRTTLDAYQHQDVPFERLVEDLMPERSTSVTPVFQIVFAVQNAPMAAQRLQGLEISQMFGEELRVRFDLEAHWFEGESGLELIWLYNKDLFDARRITQMSQHYFRILDAVLQDPNVRVDRVEILDRAEKRRLLADFQARPERVPFETVTGLFEYQAARYPEAVAILFGDTRISYAELDGQANRVAGRLRNAGARPGSLVAVRCERTPEMMAVLLGILKSGAAYLPLDLAMPRARVEMMLADSAAGFLVTPAEKLNEGFGAGLKTLPLELLLAEGGFEPVSEARYPDALAYVMYTSGSTGKPKGSAITHRGILRLVRDTDYIEFGPGDRIAQVASTSFDAAAFEIWGALLNGATLVMLDRATIINPPLFARALADLRIDSMLLTPAVLSQMARHAPDAFSGMRDLMFGGEAADVNSVREILRRGAPSRLLNLYGPTENTVVSTWHLVQTVGETASSIPIGRANANTRICVLDRYLEITPVGVTGELYVAGPGLAWGYLNRPAHSAERFVADPYGVPGERMYRTGDLVRWNTTGEIEFVGRADGQVKIRGFRVEPGEVECALREDPRVQDAHVRVWENGDLKQLLAYVIPRRDFEVRTSFVSHWQDLYESTYAEGEGSPGDFNITGWKSSYTGAPLDAGEMRIWVEETVRRIGDLKPSRVAEVGCGTGLLLTRLAGDCEEYIGVDFSGEALRQVARYTASRADLRHVKLRQGMADDLSFLLDNSVDLVILNSVVQYFPDMDYLLRVLEEAERVTRPGGHIFIGDVRSKAMLDVYHCSVQGPGATAERVAQARRNDKELVLDAGLFEAWVLRRDKLGWAEPQLKRGKYDNELSRFRYDVTLHLAEKRTEKTVVARPAQWVRWDEEGRWREHVEAAPGSIAVRGIPDARVARWVHRWRLLRDDARGETRGEDPDEIMRFARSLGATLSWEGFNSEGIYDAIFRPHRVPAQTAPEEPRAFYQSYGNSPARGEGKADLGQELKEFVRGRLPDYMTPAAVMVLDEWPLTSNGKIDRKALPVPGRADRAGSGYKEPSTETGRLLAGLWSGVLEVGGIGEEDDFFGLGGHSLMATQVMSRVRVMFGVELGVRALFDSPKLGELARAVDEARKASRSALPELKKRVRPERLPLSHAQRRLWFIDRLEESSLEYNMPEALRLQGDLNTEALRRTIATIVDRHESLRTRFIEIDGEPVQVIEPEASIALGIEDLSGFDGPSKHERVRAAVRQQSEQPFDLSRGPLIRLKLLRLADQDHILIRTCHHIVSDGWSMGVFNREFAELYEAYSEGRPNPLMPLAVQYVDFTLWQRSRLEGEDFERSAEYWKRQLAGIPARLDLPADRPRPAQMTYEAELCTMELPPARLTGLKRFANEHHATPFMTLLAAFGVLVNRYSGQDDIVVGTPIANRQNELLEPLIGFFVNTLVMRLRLRPAASFADLLAEVRRTTLDAYQHQDVPFERLVVDLAPQRSLNSAPVFQVLFALQNAPMAAFRMKGLEISRVEIEDPRVRFDLEAHFYELDGSLHLHWLYNRNLFDRWRIEQMMRHFATLLGDLTAAPFTPLRRVDLPAGATGITGGTAAPPIGSLAADFGETVRRAPDSVALVAGGESLRYAELNERADRVAARLRAMKAGPEVVVGVCLPRSIDGVVSLLAVLKTGAAYLPLDPENPAARLADIVADAAPMVVLTRRSIRKLLPESVAILDLDDMPVDEPGPSDFVADPHPQSSSYIIYTSGSTGRPKGIVLPAATLGNLMAWHETTEPGRVAQFASPGFDVSLQEVLYALLSGSTLVVPDAETRLESEKFADFLIDERITDLFATTAVIEHLAGAVIESGRSLISLRNVFQAGEALIVSPVVRSFFAAHPACRLHNHYGPAETHVVTATELPRNPEAWPYAPPIGVPIDNTRLYILDSELRTAPDGADGELYVSGHGLARGYLGRPIPTAERFVADPCSNEPGARMYRTGDIARRGPDGSIEFRGRADFQVKIRGFRIEPGEIETVLGVHPAVAQAIVVPREDPHGARQLVAWVVPARYSAFDEHALRAWLADRLPGYMVPARFVRVESFPLTVNGKVDRAALPAPGGPTAEGEDLSAAPRTDEERDLCAIFAAVLGVDSVGIHDNFFSLGGHSLMVARVASRIRGQMGVSIAMRSIFETPTVEALAARIAKEREPALAGSGYAKPSAVIRRGAKGANV